MDDTVSVHSIVDPEAGDLGRLALVMLGCRHDPRRIGEIAFLPAPGQRPIVLGREGVSR